MDQSIQIVGQGDDPARAVFGNSAQTVRQRVACEAARSPAAPCSGSIRTGHRLTPMTPLARRSPEASNATFQALPMGKKPEFLAQGEVPEQHAPACSDSQQTAVVLHRRGSIIIRPFGKM